jgi:hypothetical protein
VVPPAPLHLFDMRPAIQWVSDLQRSRGPMRVFVGENAPAGASINYHLAAQGGPVTIQIADASGNPVFNGQGPGNAGINRFQWNFTRNAGGGRGGAAAGGGGAGGAVEPGTYRVTVSSGGRSMTKPVIVMADEWLQR